MKLLLLAFTLPLMMTTVIFSQALPPIEPGVSRELAKWRAANYRNVRYKLNITLEKQAPLMKGDIEIRVNLTEEGAKNHLILDWRTTQFADDKDKPSARVTKVNGKSLMNATEQQYGIFNEHIQIGKELLRTGENVINIEFASPIKTSGAAVTRYVDKEDGAEYVYSLFVPSDASTAFPVFDQPDLKARFQLNLIYPKDWKSVSNTQSSGVLIKDNWKTSFQETQPISTYVFAFAAGDFKLFKESTTGIQDKRYKIESPTTDKIKQPIAPRRETFVYVRKSQAEKFKQHAAEVFRLNREGVKFLEDWFDYKFPFPKYDLVLIPEFPFGGMEHAGATFLREDRVIFPTEPTKNDYITRANVIFHEAAHQWFGDTVTMKWFDDLWLKEGFAEFMAYKTLAKVMPEYNAWKVFYERNKQAAYLTDVTRGTTPIYQEIPNLASAKSAYGNIVYRKAPSFLRQAEFYLGEKEFQTAVRAFLKKHEFANAEWTDLVEEFETASGKDLKVWADVWVKKSGLPIIRVSRIKYPKKLDNYYFLKQTNVLNDAELWKMRINTFIKFKNYTPGIRTDEFKDKNQIVLGAYINDAEDFVFPNYQDYGYGIFLLDEKSRAYVLENIQNEKDDFLRSMMWGSLWDSVRFYELAPEEYVRLVIKNINVEQDESTIATLLNRVSTAMNYYLTDTQTKQFAPELENLLIEKMRTAPTVGERITFYRSFVALASTEKARNVLKDILSGKFGIEGLNCRGDACRRPPTSNKSNASGQGQAQPLQNASTILKTKDKFDIVTKLITLGDADGLKLLAELEKTETDDASKRYAYAARAGIPTVENKAKYWNDFVNNKEISESYIESAFAVWNTPRHSELTLPYLEKALAELPNLKRSRKIFFVNGWLGAFIGGQKSETALNIVNKFLTDNPNLDRDLRLKILENADSLERAVKIRSKFY